MSTASAAPTCAGSPAVLRTRCRCRVRWTARAGSRRRAHETVASGHQSAPACRIASRSGCGRCAGRSRDRGHALRAVDPDVDVRVVDPAVVDRRASSGVSVIPSALAGRSLSAASSAARSDTVCSNCCGWQTHRSPHSARAVALTPSASVQNTSARSRRTLRLSVTRVRPPVPGSTPSSGVSGRLTADVAVVDQHDLVAGEGQLVAAAGRGAVAGGHELEPGVRAGVLDAVRVSFVNLQKFTLNAWVTVPSMKMLAPEQKTRGLAAARRPRVGLRDARSGSAGRHRAARCRRPGRRSSA